MALHALYIHGTQKTKIEEENFEVKIEKENFKTKLKKKKFKKKNLE